MTAADEVRGILGPELPEVKVLRLQPGDILVAKVDDGVSQERAVSLRETLQTAFPGYEVVVVSGFGLEVARPLDIDGTTDGINKSTGSVVAPPLSGNEPCSSDQNDVKGAQ